MSNFSIIFNNAWFLLLLIPALVLVFWLYFRLSKRHRRTRNRVISVVLQTLVIILSISVLAGIAFSYDEPNYTNEIILLVDLSHSTEATQNQKHEFVRIALADSDERFQIGIVTFARNPVVAVEIGPVSDVEAVYTQYRNAPLPDTSATDIARALLYSRDLLARPQTARIVLITDGIETDGDARTAILALAVDGIRVDTVFFPYELVGDNAQLIGIDIPEHLILANENVSLGARVQSSFVGAANLTLYVNGVEIESRVVELRTGIHSFNFIHEFERQGFHEIKFVLSTHRDTFANNKLYYSFIFIDVVDSILILEKHTGESDALVYLIEQYEITVLNINQAPSSLAALRLFDLVILVNIANADMPVGFDEILYDFVHDLGGGLLTIGGKRLDENGNPLLDENGNPISNTYYVNDMNPTIDGMVSPTLFQQMLPIEAVDYTPPLALMLVIDRSGSMGPGPTAYHSPQINGKYRMDFAIEGAQAAVNALSERDYVGVISFCSTINVDVPIQSAVNRRAINDAIAGIRPLGGTVFRTAIQAAGSALQEMAGIVARRHILFITDGEPNDNGRAPWGGPEDFHPESTHFDGSRMLWYEHYIQHFHETAGITLTAIAIASQDVFSSDTVDRMAELGGGNSIFLPTYADIVRLPTIMRNEAMSREIRGSIDERFRPRIMGSPSEADGLTDMDLRLPEMGGFFGVRNRTNLRPGQPGEDIVNVLQGNYSSIYSRWRFGEGRVGSFMSTLNGDDWSYDFMDSPDGIRFINNMIRALLPLSSIRARSDIRAEIEIQNFKAQVIIDTLAPEQTALPSGYTLSVRIAGTSNNVTLPPITPFQSGRLFIAQFEFSYSGIYQIIIERKNAAGIIVSSQTIFTSFSYSDEYNVFMHTEESGRNLLSFIANHSDGEFIDDAGTDLIFAGIRPYLERNIDPRVVMIIIALVLFLLDVAVRKFKFKWPHEIIRDRKIKKIIEQQAGG